MIESAERGNRFTCRRSGFTGLQTADLRRFPDPGVVVAVAVEENPLVLLDSLADQLVQAGVKVRLAVLQHIREALQGIRDRAVDHDVCAGDGVV